MALIPKIELNDWPVEELGEMDIGSQAGEGSEERAKRELEAVMKKIDPSVR